MVNWKKLNQFFVFFYLKNSSIMKATSPNPIEKNPIKQMNLASPLKMANAPNLSCILYFFV